MAAWVFLALVMVNGSIATAAATLVFLTGLIGTLKGSQRIGVAYDHEEKVLELLAQNPTSVDAFPLAPGFKDPWVPATIARLRERGEILADGEILETASRSNELESTAIPGDVRTSPTASATERR